MTTVMPVTARNWAADFIMDVRRYHQQPEVCIRLNRKETLRAAINHADDWLYHCPHVEMRAAARAAIAVLENLIGKESK